MKPIDDYIRDNRKLFDVDEPPEGHLSRFHIKLEDSGRSRRSKTLPVFLRIAAVLLVGLFISGLLYGILSLYSSTVDNDSCLNKELCEAENYYLEQAETYYQRIEKMPFNHDPQTRKEILKELREMDSQVAGMKEDLKQNPNDERVIHTIINYYQEKIDLMDMIITRTSGSSNEIL